VPKHTLLLLSVPILFFLLLPSLVIVPMALTKGQGLQFPPEWISVHAFTDYLEDPNWISSTLLSLQIAASAAALGAICGTSAAIALHGRTFPGRSLVAGIIMAPIVVPLVVLALGDYLLFAKLRLVGSALAIGLAHGLLATPHVFISVQTSLTASLDPALVRSARSLGAGFLSVLRHVYWPAVRPGVIAGSLLGFAVSFDEVVIALFLQGAETVTLPVRMFTAIQYELTPKIAPASSVFLAVALLVLLLQALGRREALP
jgi:ABC-type spermidine/putrescine transport system permease subunit II